MGWGFFRGFFCFVCLGYVVVFVLNCFLFWGFFGLCFFFFFFFLGGGVVCEGWSTFLFVFLEVVFFIRVLMIFVLVFLLLKYVLVKILYDIIMYNSCCLKLKKQHKTN